MSLGAKSNFACEARLNPCCGRLGGAGGAGAERVAASELNVDISGDEMLMFSALEEKKAEAPSTPTAERGIARHVTVASMSCRAFALATAGQRRRKATEAQMDCKCAQRLSSAAAHPSLFLNRLHGEAHVDAHSFGAFRPQVPLRYAAVLVVLASLPTNNHYHQRAPPQ